jgi:recombination protein RecR
METHPHPLNALDLLIKLLGKLPGLGQRSARRIALQLIKKRELLLQPLLQALLAVEAQVQSCSLCGNLDVASVCGICQDSRRDRQLLCVVEEVADLWALERSGSYRGLYHVLGGHLSALDGVGPSELRIQALVDRVNDNRLELEDRVQEVMLATNATVEGQTTAFYITEQLKPSGVRVTRLAFGLPLGGELDYLDDGTLSTAIQARQVF